MVWAAAYTPFGEARVCKDEVTNSLRFPGQYYDVETGLHYNWHRYYDPGTGRYLRLDPIGLDGGINPYVYALNSPANWIDPDGEIPDFAGVVIGKVLAVGVGYVGAKIAAAFVSEEASDGVDMAMGKVTAINATEIAGMAAGEIAGAAIGFGIRGIRTCATKSKIRKAADGIESHLGPGSKPTVNEAGDLVIESANGAKKVRFDMNDPSPHKSPHGHVEEFRI